MAKMDIRVTVPADHYTHMVIIERHVIATNDPPTIQTIFCTDLFEANAHMMKALSECQTHCRIDVAIGPIMLRGTAYGE